MNKRILVLPGDGIGPEVMTVATAVLQAIAVRFGHNFIVTQGLIGAAALAVTGEPLPKQTIAQCQQIEAVLLGAVGDPHYEHNAVSLRPEQGLLGLRQHLGVYANIRPVQVWPQLQAASSLKTAVIEGVNFIFFRELLAGLYFGKPRGRSSDGETAVDTMRYSKAEVRRIVRLAFQAAQQRSKKLCSVDKANVLECSRLWREVVIEQAKQWPDVAVTHMYVDNAAMQIIRQPKQFDVIVTENMFGDILSDEAAQVAGSLGLLASASLGDRIALYEPVHGSAPDIAGHNRANPIGAIVSVALMLEYSFGLKAETAAIHTALSQTLTAGWRTADLATALTPPDHVLDTSVFGQKLIQYI
ncbi:MAG: 3-isopropylmalate dehydrogenase [Candidatus Kerfeldbacteria bacterium]|nr:3-isopropylmalate dehydrogenase [Candidatus Kerfeldbacteria bacterium]